MNTSEEAIRWRAAYLGRLMAQQNAYLDQIHDAIIADVEPEMRRIVDLSVPDHGSEYMREMWKSILWGLAIYAGLMIVGSMANGEAAAVGWFVFLGIAIFGWAAAFGAHNGSEARADARSKALSEMRNGVSEICRTEAVRVWSAEVGGRWKPTGPDPFRMAISVEKMPQAWMSRFRSNGADAGSDIMVSESSVDVASVRSAIAKAESFNVEDRRQDWWPVVFAVKGPVFPGAIEYANQTGVAIFVVTTDKFVGKSTAAIAAVADYKNPSARRPPIGVLRWHWDLAETNRRALAQSAVLVASDEWKSPALSALPEWRLAEERAADYLRQFGARNVEVTQATRDGGVDVAADGIVCQVKQWRNSKVPESEVQRLFGIAASTSSLGVFFSPSGYRPDAVRFAESVNVALFQPGDDWTSVEGLTPIARRVLREGFAEVLGERR